MQAWTFQSLQSFSTMTIFFNYHNFFQLSQSFSIITIFFNHYNFFQSLYFFFSVITISKCGFNSVGGFVYILFWILIAFFMAVSIQSVVSIALVVLFIFFFEFWLRFLWPTRYIAYIEVSLDKSTLRNVRLKWNIIAERLIPTPCW